MRKLCTLLWLLIVCSFWLSCGGGPTPPAGSPSPNPATPASAKPSPAATPTSQPAGLEEGKKLYGQYCATCHGANGEPDDPKLRATDLTDAKLQAKWTDDYLKDVIIKGKDTMPPTAVSDDEAKKITTFTRTLQKK